jgi:CYTH domain-containing protein
MAAPRAGDAAGRAGPTGLGGHRDKYALVERERRFLLRARPDVPALAVRSLAVRSIVDRYLDGTRLRLRRVTGPATGQVEWKLTQKVPFGRPGPARGLITNTYLDEAEYGLLATLPAAVVTKTRHRIPPFVVDVFDPPRHGLVIAEVEFTTDAAAAEFAAPGYAVAEVTDDPRLTGGHLARASRPDLARWLADYGLRLPERASSPA